MEALNDWFKRKILYRSNCIRILFEDKNNRVWHDYYKKTVQGKQEIVSINKKTYFLGNSYRYNMHGVPYYKVKENVTNTLNWEDVKTVQTLTASEIDEYTNTKIFIDVMRMSSGDLNWKVIGIIVVIVIVIGIIYMKMQESGVSP